MDTPAEETVKLPEPASKPKPKKRTKSKPKPKKKAKRPTKSKPKKRKAIKSKSKKKAAQPDARSERLDMRLTKAQKARIYAKAKKTRRTVTSLVIEAIEKIR